MTIGRARESGKSHAPPRPTHRLQTWPSRDAVPELLDLTVDGDTAYGPAGTVVAVRGRDEQWYWADGVPPPRWQIQALPGRRPRGSTAASRDVRVRLADDRAVTLHLSEEEYAELVAAAGEQELATWAREAIGRRRPKSAEAREILLGIARRHG